MRYLITGSEDRGVYIYDIGMQELVHRTKNADHGDSVSDVAVNPRYLEWATGCFDGHVRVFRHPIIKKTITVTGKGGGVVDKTAAYTPSEEKELVFN